MRTIKLTIEYDGTNYNGWQVQASQDSHHQKLTTIQGVIQETLKKIFRKKMIVIGSGRTDSGVHALAQIAHFRTVSKMPIARIKAALNGTLPPDIAVLKVEEVDPKFHAQYSAKAKTYRYTILNRDVRSPILRNTILLYPHKLNLTLMRREAKFFVGKKNFKSFQATPDKRFPWKAKNTVRTIKRLEIKKKGDVITIDIEANGFLHKMVRNIVGTLLEIGRGHLPAGSVQKILSKKDRTVAPATAKPYGLTLLKVEYR